MFPRHLVDEQLCVPEWRIRTASGCYYDILENGDMILPNTGERTGWRFLGLNYGRAFIFRTQLTVTYLEDIQLAKYLIRILDTQRHSVVLKDRPIEIWVRPETLDSSVLVRRPK